MQNSRGTVSVIFSGKVQVMYSGS